MKTIFKNMKGEWDWFGIIDPTDYGNWRYEIWSLGVFKGEGLTINSLEHGEVCYSLADLLTNKSWCKAVWGEKAGEAYGADWEYFSNIAYKILRDSGQQACIDYIKETMV